MKPTETTISLLTIFVLLIFVIMAIIKGFNSSDYAYRQQHKKQQLNQPYNKDKVLKRLKE